MITGFKDTSNSLNTKVQPTTVQNVGRFRQGVDTVAQVYFEDVTTDTSEAGSSYNTINATGHSANVGDLIEITSGTYQRVKVFVQSVTTDQIVLSQRFPTEIGASVTFTICAPAVPKVSSSGAVTVSATISSPITPLTSTTGNAVMVSGPMGMMYLGASSFQAGTTDQVLNITAVPGGTYRGDIVAIGASTPGTPYITSNVVGEIESVSGNTVTLKNPLPFTPAAQEIYFLRRAYLPLIASTRNIGVPVLPVNIADNMIIDGQDPSGSGVLNPGLPISAWDLNNSVYRGIKLRTGAPGSSDHGVVVRDVDSPAIAASLSVIDDWDESDRAKVNLIAGQAGVQGGSGTVSANTQRVVLATDVALPAGTNNIGDVDVLTLPALPAGSNTIGAVTFATPTQSGGPSKAYYPSLTNTGTTAVSSARKITGYCVGNASTTNSAFIKIYDKASAATSSDTPIRKICLAPLASAHINLGPSPLLVTNGFSIRATTIVTDSNTTSPTANDVFMDIEYV